MSYRQTEPENDNIHGRIEAELIRLLYQNALIAIIGTSISAVLFFLVLWNIVPLWLNSSWLIILLVLYAVRLYGILQVFRYKPTDEQTSALEQRFVIGAFFSGVLWGIAGIFVFIYGPHDYYRTAMLILCGLAAAAMTTHAPVRRAYYAFVFPTLVPIIIAALLKGEIFDIALAILTIIFMIVMLLLANQINGTFRKELESRFINEKLVNSLQTSEEKYRDLFENANDMIFTIDLAGNFTSVNQSFSDTLGYSIKELNEKNIRDVLDPDSFNFISGLLEKAITKKSDMKELQPWEVKTIGKHGDERIVEIRTRFIWDERQIVGIHGIARNITERKLVEEHLKRSETNLAKAQQLAHVGNWGWNILTNKLYWSDEIYRIFGLTPQQFGATYDAFLETIHPGDRDSVINAVNEAVYNNKPYNTEHRIVRPDGTIRIVNEQGEVTYDENNKPVMMIGIIQDITERKHYEEQLKEANAAKDKFFSIIAHDLKNPFNVLLGFSQILSENLSELGKDELRDIIRRINNSAQSAYTLIENLLQWSRAQTGRLEYNPTKIELKPLVEEIFKILAGQAENKQIKLINEAQPFYVYADPNLAKTILRNLLSNAIKYTDTGGSVSVSSKQDNTMAEISVRDTGVGIPPDAMEKIFRIDTKYSTPGTAKETGTGLGLILCKEFIEKHGGRIWVESEVGKGTTFTFTLPVITKMTDNKL